MQNDLLKFPVCWTSFESCAKFDLVPAQPVVQPLVGGQLARDEISTVEESQMSRRQPELLEWPVACICVLQVLKPKPHRVIVVIDLKDARRAQRAGEVDEKPRAVCQDLTGGSRYLALLVESRPPNDFDHAGPWDLFMPPN